MGAVSRDEAAEVVELLELDLEAMIQYGLVHLVDGDRICKASLFARHHDSH